jgi:DME family drug/metabolite transporter
VFRERFGLPKVLAVAVGMAGVVLVSTGGRFSSLSGATLAGDLLVFAAAFLWTAFILLDKKIVAGGEVDVQALTTAMVIVTGISALPAALVLGRGAAPEPSMDLWVVGYTAVFCTVVPFFLWTWGLKHITATTSSVIMLAEVVFAVALAAVVLGERMTPWAMLGSALILAAVALVTRDRAEEAPVGPDVAPEWPHDPASGGER